MNWSLERQIAAVKRLFVATMRRLFCVDVGAFEAALAAAATEAAECTGKDHTLSWRLWHAVSLAARMAADFPPEEGDICMLVQQLAEIANAILEAERPQSRAEGLIAVCADWVQSAQIEH